MKKNTLLNLGILVVMISVLSSCSLRYSDQGKPFDFLKAKRYKAVQKGADQNEKALAEEQNDSKEKPAEKRAQKVVKTAEGTTGVQRQDSVLEIVLIVLLVLLAIALFSLIDGLLGGLLGAIILVLVIVFLLRYLGVI